MTQTSAIYVGKVGHTRLRPRRHSLAYRVFMLLLDLDELPELNRRLKVFSIGRFNLLSFRAQDFGDGSETSLRAQIEQRLDAAGYPIEGGPIRLLCLPRVLGYAFNPISIFFCYGMDGHLAATLYEVSSTFGERHAYLAPADSTSHGEIHQTAQKRLHVSPFMDMQMVYDFRLTEPGERFSLNILASDEAGPILTTYFSGRRWPLDDAALLKAWFAHPFVTLKVIIAIHWEAAKLLAKGLKLRRGPAAPADGFSLGELKS